MSTRTQNIAVIGGGIMGLSAAYTLLRAGHALTIYDPKGFPAHNASAMAGGMLAPYSEIEHMPMAWVQAGLEGISAWKDFVDEHGSNIGFVQNGSLLIAHREDIHMLERFKTHLPDGMRKTRVPQTLETDLPKKFNIALHLPEEASLKPNLTLLALCGIIKALGGTLIENSMDVNETNTEVSRLAGTYDHIIDCRGYDAADDDPDLRGVKGEMLLVRNPEFSLSRPVRMMHPRYPLYIVPRPNHEFMIGATMIESADDSHVSLRSGLELMSALYSLHPSFGEAEILEICAGLRPSYSDNLPRVHTQGNIIRCNGLFRHGYLLAPIMARYVANIVTGEKSPAYGHLFEGDKNSHEDHCKRGATDIRGAA